LGRGSGTGPSSDTVPASVEAGGLPAAEGLPATLNVDGAPGGDEPAQDGIGAPELGGGSARSYRSVVGGPDWSAGSLRLERDSGASSRAAMTTRGSDAAVGAVFNTDASRAAAVEVGGVAAILGGST
jgi:hypothetical protein